MSKFSVADPAHAGHIPAWHEIAGRFTDPRACLASFLAMEGAEVVAGVKPGNLVNIVNRTRPCGQNPYLLWRAHGPVLLAGTGLKAVELRDRGNALLLYIYRPELLREVVRHRGVALLLRRWGYRNLADLHQTLVELAGRCQAQDFPHEIGIFLGYPAKDVLAFKGDLSLPFACQGPWKIYGNPQPSLALAARFRQCRQRMARRLATSNDPLHCLGAAA